MIQFHETIMGKRFFEGTVPSVLHALQEIAKELKRANDLKEKEMEKKEKTNNEEKTSIRWTEMGC